MTDHLAQVIVTHALAFAGGGAAMRWWITRKVRVRDLDGHVALELRHPDDDED